MVLAEPAPGNLLDISLHGARLSVPRIQLGDYHIFYACSDDPDKIIQLEARDQERGEMLVVPARPVWFNYVVSEAGNHFELGVKFPGSPENRDMVRLRALFSGKPAASVGGWLKKLFRLA